MSTLTHAFASSHSVMLTCELEDWQNRFESVDPRGTYFDKQGNPVSYQELLARAPANARELIDKNVMAKRFSDVHEAMARMKKDVEAAKLDVLIVSGDDQHELFQDTQMPSIGIYYGDSIRNAQRREVPADNWFKRAQMRRLEETGDKHYPCHGGLALHLIKGLVGRGFDITAVQGLVGDQFEGHAFSFIHRFFLRDAVIPIVPIFLNTAYPPNQPTPPRCLALGQALGELIASFPENIRVGFMASGGLSHFQAEEDLDRPVIDAMQRKDLKFLSGLNPKRLQQGSSEIRNWIVLAGLAGHLDMKWISYTPAYRTPALTGTGLAFAAWN